MNIKLINMFKKNREVIVIVLILILLILFRATGKNHFKSDAKKWAESSINQSEIVITEKLGLPAGKNLIINLDKDTSRLKKNNSELWNMSPDSLLSKKYINSILKHDGPVLLYSANPGVSARVWMLISQMGRKKLYILSDKADNEVLKYKFKPDSLPGNSL
jgi:hypothetical protein